MALLITITDAGRAEIINADNTGTGPVLIAEIGFGTGQYAPSKAQTALTAEVKRVSSIAGQAVAADTIHVMAKDEGPDAYNVGEFGLYSAAGTLVAVYSQTAAAGWIIQKAGASTLLLAVDIILESLDATSLSFGDITFLNPPATTETPGVVQLENSLTSPSTSKALTAAQGKKLQDEKEPAFAAGTTAQYRRGDKTWQDLAAAVRAVVMTGLSTAASTAVAAADSLLVAIGKLQAQITGLNNTKLDTTANAVSASKLATARTIGGVSFDGTANINLPGVNAAGNQNTTGNAGTATKLATARTINGVSFDGTANISVADATRILKQHSVDTVSYSAGGPEIRELNAQGAGTGVLSEAPRLTFHWGGRKAAQIVMESTGRVMIRNQAGTDYEDFAAQDVTATGSLSVAGAVALTESASYEANNYVGGWARGFTYTDAGALVGAVGGYGSGGGALANVYMGVGSQPWSSGNAVRVTTSGITLDGITSITDKVVVSGTGNRSAGMYGIYDSAKTAHVWSMGTPYAIPDDGTTFGTLYGLAYKHTNNTTGGTMAGGHQLVACSNGTPGVALGLAGGIWTSGLTDTATLKVNGQVTLLNSTLLDGTANGLKITNGASGTVEIGNRNTGYTHYGSSTGNHYFYGSVSIQSNLSIAGIATGLTAAAGTNTTQLATTAFVQAAVGIGSVSAFARSTAPTGWLKCNGATISRTTYDDLFAAIGTTFGAGDGSTTFKIPDLRGEFVRGWDDARSVDDNRVFGSFQADEFKSHQHDLPCDLVGSSDLYTLSNTSNADEGFNGGHLTAATGGVETRPRNIALLYCIKY